MTELHNQPFFHGSASTTDAGKHMSFALCIGHGYSCLPDAYTASLSVRIRAVNRLLPAAAFSNEGGLALTPPTFARLRVKGPIQEVA